MDSGCPSGGILKLRELISEHPSEFAYDFRTRFNLSIFDVGYGLSFGEAVLLVAALLRDPTSWLQAATNDWKAPASPEWQLLARLVDVQTMSKSKNKVKPVERPWPDKSVSRIGGTTEIPQDRLRSVLDAMRSKESDVQ